MEVAPHPATEKSGTTDVNQPQKNADLKVGAQIFERFILTAILGEGRCSTAWLADDPRFRRDVVLKIFHSAGNDNADAERRIWRELLRRLRILNHPNVAMSMEFFNEGPWIAISNQLVEGKSLAVLTFLAGTKLPQAESESILKLVGMAMSAAHRKSHVFHGNLNAYNILLTDGDRRPKITDFGFHPPISSPEENPDWKWKTACLSPERLAGDAPSVGDDIYAFATIAFQLFTGTNPPKTSTGLIDTAALPGLIEAMPINWRNSLLTCFSPDIAARPKSMESLLQDLGLFEATPEIDPETQKAHFRGASKRKHVGRTRLSKSRQSKSNRWTRFFIVLCAIAMPCILGWTIYQSVTSNRKLEIERANAELEEKANEAVRKAEMAKLEARIGVTIPPTQQNPGKNPPATEISKQIKKATPLIINSGARSLYQEGQAKFAAGDASGALESYGMAIVLQSDWPDLLEARALAMMTDDQAGNAADEYTKVLTLEPTRSSSLLGRAKALMALNKNEEARADLEALLKLQPDHVEAKAEMDKLTAARRD